MVLTAPTVCDMLAVLAVLKGELEGEDEQCSRELVPHRRGTASTIGSRMSGYPRSAGTRIGSQGVALGRTRRSIGGRVLNLEVAMFDGAKLGSWKNRVVRLMHKPQLQMGAASDPDLTHPP